jgi:multiple sugar transport system ATP-binding protein
MAGIKLQNVTKVFDGNVTAVSDFSLTVEDGEFVVIVGPSGCGKTTTLRMIAGLEKPTLGTISIAGKPANELSPKDRDIAMVFQNYALYPHMTAFRNIAFALKMRKIPRRQIKASVKHAASTLGIENLLHRKPAALSGGQRQRVALARAIVRTPNAFLFDEPLSNLDIAQRTTARIELKAIQQKLNTTTIYVTHDQAEAMTLADRICVMRNGAIEQIAAPLELYCKPVNRFVAAFIGSPAMNFLPGRLEITPESISIILGKDTIELPQRFRSLLDRFDNKHVLLGIRPEYLSPVDSPDPGANTITAKVTLIEPTGAVANVHLVTESGGQFVARLDLRKTPALGDAVLIQLDAENLHVFDTEESGKNLTVATVATD